MLLTEYDENLHINNEKNISFEEGLERGLEEGRQEGITNIFEIMDRLNAGESPETIISSGVSPDLVQKVLARLNQ